MTPSLPLPSRRHLCSPVSPFPSVAWDKGLQE